MNRRNVWGLGVLKGALIAGLWASGPLILGFLQACGGSGGGWGWRSGADPTEEVGVTSTARALTLSGVLT